MKRQMSLFLDPERGTLAEGTVPRQVPTVFKYRTSGRKLIIGLIGGGVIIHPMQTVRTIDFKSGAGKRLDGIRKAAANQRRPEEHPWWWD